MTSPPATEPVPQRFRKCLTEDLRRLRALSTGRPADAPLSASDWLSILSPRFQPVLLQRIAYALYANRLGVIGKLVASLNYAIYGIEIGVRCRIGGGLVLPHTQGTVIGAIAIGENATIFQGVTLGAKEMDFSYGDDKRPIVGDNVVIGAGAKVLGGIRIGNNVLIGANTVVGKSLPDGTAAVGAAMRIVGDSTG